MMLSRYVVSQVKHNSYFLVGLGIGLWLALAVVPLDEEVTECAGIAGAAGLVAGAGSEGAAGDEYEPRREERPLGPAGQPGRSVQRPRYYSTELGMRGGLLAGVLSSEEVLETRAAALNQTAARLQPALRFFITASALQAAPGRANVVGFTDTREMLKPFHALKYLADNYLEEYDFFFLVSDTTYVNARRLTELVSQLSVSQDIYMGVVSDDDTHYCTLEGGILMSNSVLRAVHGELDWCVRNSYSPQHHENIGRCVLHAAHRRCASAAQGQQYAALRLPPAPALPAPGALAGAVAAHPALAPARFHQLHAYAAREALQRARAAAARAAARAGRSARRHPRGFRNATWPRALRDDAGLAPPAPPTRFDHLRWTRFNATHAWQWGERALAPLRGAHAAAARRLLRHARAWAARRRRVPAAAVRVLHAAWCWDPPRALRYRLLLRAGGLLQAAAARALGAARLAPARYVTESARVRVLAAAPARLARAAAAFLRRYDAACLQRDANTALTLVIVSSEEPLTPEQEADVTALREAARALSAAHVDTLEAAEPGQHAPDQHASDQHEPGQHTPGQYAPRSDAELLAGAQRVALATALPRLAHDALVLLLDPRVDFNEDFLNRVRMNTIIGEQWFAPLAFARYVHPPPAPPASAAAPGPPAAGPPAAGPPGAPGPPAARPALDAGRFETRARSAVAFYRQDYEDALEKWSRSASGAGEWWAADVLAASGLRALRAPEPGLLLAAGGPPCAGAGLGSGAGPGAARCLRASWPDLRLGARHTLAKLLLQTQAELA